MVFYFDNEKMPEVFKRDRREYYLDPIRQKLILVTPEETVRQKMISFLITSLNIPEKLISVEEKLSHYKIQSNLRADIIIHGNDDNGNKYPLCIIECKAPEVPLVDKSCEQVFEYCDHLGADYAIVTNGYTTFIFKYDEEKSNYIRLEEIPTFDEMLNGKYIEYDWGEFPDRQPFEKLKKNVENNQYDDFISSMTPKPIALAAYNLLECFLDYRVQLPAGNYGCYNVIKDYGVRMLCYGNGSGGKFQGPYRSFLIDHNGNAEFVSFTITTYWKSASADNIRTVLCVAIDDDESAHHALQMVLDENLIVAEELCEFYHHGRIAIGRIGSGKISELREIVSQKRPDLIRGNQFYLGSLKNDRLWRLDDPEVIKVISNLISYALLRDEYRKKKKAENNR